MPQTAFDFWKGRRVLITGHMGFKGAWLCSLLSKLGAITHGFGKDDRKHLLYKELAIERHVHVSGDVTNLLSVKEALGNAEPEVIFHLAAQPLVLASLSDPVATFHTNIIGTVSVLEAARCVPGIKAVVVVTSDKVYQNNEWVWAYRENDPLGGNDPYSASKAATEIAARAMAISYFAGGMAARIATARAGNVIGGGDWAEHRLLPDAARAFAKGEPLVVRNPHSTRPWQHVLDSLGGYLVLAQHLFEGHSPQFGSWNFGPSHDEILPVSKVADMFATAWGSNARWAALPSDASQKQKREARFLAVDSSLARRDLGWRPRWTVEEAVHRTVVWYRDQAAGGRSDRLVDRDVSDFLSV